jgi:hypothetical protein
MIRPVPLGLPIAAAVAYVMTPGAPDVPLAGLPIGQAGIVTLVLVVGAWLWTRRTAPPVRFALVAVLVLLAVIKLSLAAVTPQSGWLARYYANATFEPPVERSLDFRHLPATRIDRVLAFKETQFPVHFFNNRGYNQGVYREWTMPFSVSWTGYVTVSEPVDAKGALAVNGRAEVWLDGARVGVITAAGGQTGTGDFVLRLTPGTHQIEFRYQKPAETHGLFVLGRSPGDASPRSFMDDAVTPFETDPSALARRPIASAAGWLLHVIALVVVGVALWPALRSRPAGDSLVAPLVVLLLLGQGLWKSRHLVGHVWTLSGGDDWLNYEMSARDAVLNGLMMSEGGVIGRGQPFSLYPGYAYFVAFVHWLTGESLAGVVLVNFVLLAAATLVAHRIARHLFGPLAAICGVVWLLALEQADFVRYYTVTLFSENLYFVLAASTVLFLVRYHRSGRTGELVGAALAGAMASITRPSMMLLLPFALLLIAVERWRNGGIRRLLTDAAVLATVWMVALTPITIRNYLMSGRAVLITAGQGATFIMYNMPVSDPRYFKGYDGTLFNAAKVLLLMLIEHPMVSLKNYATKAAFSLGMVHWMGSGTVHPELVATSVLYGLAFAVVPAMRALAAWPMHLFIATHVLTLTLTMPSNYGYRMILPAFVFLSLGAGAVLAPLLRRIAARWPPAARVVGAVS